MIPENLKFDAAGLIPVVIQDRASGDVLMLGYANALALARTAETGYAHFWSRSRQSLWRKGETSGHGLRVREARTDCDRDTVLLVCDPEGPTCHTGDRTCFGPDTPTAAGILDGLERTIAERLRDRPSDSYTAALSAGGLDAVLAKLREETGELAESIQTESGERIAEEAADLLYHLEVALAQREVPLTAVLDVLARRRKR